MSNTVFISSIATQGYTDFDGFSIAANQFQKRMMKAFPFKAMYSFNVHPGVKKRVLHQQETSYYYIYPANKLMRIFYIFHFAFSINPFICKKTNVVLYNIHNRNIWMYLFFKIWKAAKIFVLLADYAQPNKSLLQRLYYQFVKKANGVISLSANAVNKNMVVQQLLIADEAAAADDIDKHHNDFQILFSGTIGQTMGVHIAIQAMKYLPQYTLHISGPLYYINEKTFVEMLHHATPNVVYHGILNQQDYLKLLKSCATCLSLRDPQNTDHQNNFPSKIGEYLYYNKVVISSIAYPNFEEKIVFTKWDAESLAENISNHQATHHNNKQWLITQFGFDTFKKNLSHIIHASQ